MPSLTDDDLDRMLRATFAAHDHLADPDRARHLAATVVDTVGAGGARPRTRRWVAGLAAASVVALGVARPRSGAIGIRATRRHPRRRPAGHRRARPWWRSAVRRSGRGSSRSGRPDVRATRRSRPGRRPPGR